MRGAGTTVELLEEQALAEHARRWAARPAGRVAVVLHFSRLPPPGPRPHHRRIAEALMDDVALAEEGRLYRLRNGDLALLCATGVSRGGSADAAGLPGVLGRLLSADVPDPATIVSVWPLATDAASLLTYARGRLRELSPTAPVVAEPVQVTPPSPPGAPRMSGTERAREIADALARIDPTHIVRRQTAAAVDPAHGLVALYREATLSIAAGETDAAAGSSWSGFGGDDPFLSCHLAGLLDAKMLAMVADALGRGGPLDAAAEGCPLHLNLMLATIGSAAFATFAADCVRAGATLGVELPLLDACADPVGLDLARDILARHGMALVLDGVSHAALRIARVGTLRPDMLKLDWAPALADLAEPEAHALDVALREIGLGRVVLHRAETEAALRWGRSRGIRRFQGRHVDAMLAATRLASCAHAAGCTFRQCVGRAGAATSAGRADCRDPARLDGSAREHALGTVLAA